MNYELTKGECTALRGWAIIIIALHNYCHWVSRTINENEFTWISSSNSDFLHVLLHPDALLPVQLLSFLGFHGISVFLFLSGYGLVMKYEQSPLAQAKTVSIWQFLKYNYLKLFRLLVVGFAIFVLVNLFSVKPYAYSWKEVLALLTMTINFHGLPNPGPYWYFGLMLQLYILYRLVLYRWRHWSVVVTLVLVTLLVQAFFPGDSDTLRLLRINFVGNLLPFGAGLLFARHYTGAMPSGKTLYAAVFVLSLVLIVLMGYNYYSWLLIPLVALLNAVALVRLIPASWHKPLHWTGVISAVVFIVHPSVRNLFIFTFRDHYPYLGLFLYIIVTLVLSWLVSKILDKIPRPTLTWTPRQTSCQDS